MRCLCWGDGAVGLRTDRGLVVTTEVTFRVMVGGGWMGGGGLRDGGESGV